MIRWRFVFLTLMADVVDMLLRLGTWTLVVWVDLSLAISACLQSNNKPTFLILFVVRFLETTFGTFPCHTACLVWIYNCSVCVPCAYESFHLDRDVEPSHVFTCDRYTWTKVNTLQNSKFQVFGHGCQPSTSQFAGFCFSIFGKDPPPCSPCSIAFPKVRCSNPCWSVPPARRLWLEMLAVFPEKFMSFHMVVSIHGGNVTQNGWFSDENPIEMEEDHFSCRNGRKISYFRPKNINRLRSNCDTV